MSIGSIVRRRSDSLQQQCMSIKLEAAEHARARLEATQMELEAEHERTEFRQTLHDELQQDFTAITLASRHSYKFPAGQIQRSKS